MTCDDDDGTTLCGPPPTALSTLLSLSPFILTFLCAFFVAATRLFPYLSTFRSPDSSSSFSSSSVDLDDGEDHLLPATAPATLRQAHLLHKRGRDRPRARAAAAAFGATVGLAVVLGELILAEILELAEPGARGLAVRVTVGSLLVMLVGVVPALEAGSVVDAFGMAGWRGRGKGRGKRRVAWGLQVVVFAAWLGVFWGVGRMVPEGRGGGYGGAVVGGEEKAGGVDNTAASLARGMAPPRPDGVVVGVWGEGGLSRACLERIGVIGISLMALLSGFASVSSPWHTFVDNRAYRRRPVTDADIARKQAGLDATSEMLITKKHRLRSLQRKLAAASDAAAASSGSTGFVGKMIGSLKGIGGGGGDAAEIKALQVEISGLEAMEASLTSSLSVLRNRQAAHARDGTALGRILSMPGYVFSLYCIYRILATCLTTLRRVYQPQSSFSSSDPINRFLGLLARHWDPKLDQIAWARMISFLLSGVILAASANSVLQTFHLFARWAPALLRQAQANLALIIGQIAATYVISSALLLRSNLPRDVGRSVGDALESALEPAFVDRWFEGWFLLASAATAVGIWVGRQIGGSGMLGEWDDWDDFGAEELGTKRS
ncbi:Golgi pH regulator [Coniochaeta hoffmannii]|uniref:Golgi pH regulator n=1 Tax=Coniochaeta hoffmannii TaxID=91930 RepID=A0AA38VH29_9PEZI|nr:Golgi pH regulator [Coniochaeta hoffmannii]